MRKRSKYRPRPVILDTMGYVKQGMLPADKGTTLKVATQMHLALELLHKGQGTRLDWDSLAESINVSLILAKDHDVGREYHHDILAAREALLAVGQRAVANGMRFELQPGELGALRKVIDIHEAQIAASNRDTMAKAAARVMELIRSAPTLSPTKDIAHA